MNNTELVNTLNKASESISDNIALSMLLKIAGERIAHLEYKIDELMLEYCPNEMTEEQLENYKKHQRPYLDEAVQGLGDL